MTGSSIVFRPLITKISTPTSAEHSFERTRLEFSNAQKRDLKLIGIVAPAGYGKSTLMAQWKTQLEKQNRLCAWLNLDEEENDSANFFRYLVHSLNQIDPVICREALSTLEAGSLGDPKPIWKSVLRNLSQEPRQYALFLDDFHKITHPDVLRFVEWMIEHLPENLTLVVASRPKLKLDIPKLQSCEPMEIYEFQDLRFNLEETQLFLNEFHDFNLKPEQIKSIHDNSEGWVLMLQMISILAKRGQDLGEIIAAFSGKREDLGAYLSEVIVESGDEDLKNFIQKISVMDRFCAELLDEVLEIKNSRKLLQQAQEENLFLIGLDDEHRWFRFHHLFGDYLKENLREGFPELEKRLQLKASAWFETQALFPEAIEYALRAEDFDAAGRLISAFAPEIVENKGDTTTLVQWMQRLPKEFKIKYPAIWPSLILSYTNSHQPKKAEEENRLYQESIENMHRQHGLDENTYQSFQATVDFHRVHACTFEGKIEKLRDGIPAWLKKWPRAADYQIASMHMSMGTFCIYTHEYQMGLSGVQRGIKFSLEIKNYYAYVWAVSLMSAIHLRRAHNDESIEWSRGNLPLVREKIGSQSYAFYMLEMHCAVVFYAQGKLPKAWDHLTMPLHYLENWGGHYNIIDFLTTYAHLHSLQKDFSRAIEQVRFGQKLGKKRRHFFLVTYFKTLEIELELLQNHLANAKKIDDTLEDDLISSREDRFIHAYQKDFQFLAKVRIALFQKQGRAVISKLNTYVEHLKNSERIRDLVYALILQATAFYQARQKPKALQALREALELALPGECAMPFVEHRSYLGEFFQEAFELFQKKKSGQNRSQLSSSLSKIDAMGNPRNTRRHPHQKRNRNPSSPRIRKEQPRARQAALH